MTGGMTPPGRDRPHRKRFYRTAAVAKGGMGGFAVVLDGKPVLTPGKRPFVLPTAALAGAAAAEWNAQGSAIDPAAMPLTRLANSAIDGVAGREAAVAADITAYAGRDLLCYRAEAPEALAARQAALWNPVLRWAEVRFEARFAVTAGIMPVAQDAAVLSGVQRALDGRTAFALAALHVLTTLTGSAVLALAVAEKHLAAEAAWDAAHVDEDWQAAHWGRDAEAAARQERRRQEFSAAAKFLALAEGR